MCPSGSLITGPGTADGPLDWNCNGTAAGTVSSDINGDGSRTMLTGHLDWGALVFDGGTIGNGDQLRRVVAPPPAELTLQEYRRAHR